MLIIVESPTKATKIRSLLKVKTLSTVGHFKDLPDSTLGVDLSTYEPTFVCHEKKRQLPDALRAAAAGEVVMLAGDPDREGYAISRHVYEEVREVAQECRRMEIYEVTEKGLREALARAVPFEATNQGLYDAFLGRRVGDRLVGYILSPLASRTLKRPCSVGRVQSPAVRLVVDREREIRAFVPAPYWILSIQLAKEGTSFTAYHLKGKFERQEDAALLVAAIRNQGHALVENVHRREVKQSPRPPFTTVDLQATAAARLRFTPEQTMKLAQGLFDQGLITYHRTDSVRMDEAFITEIRAFLGASLGREYLPPRPNKFTSKHSQAEAHEGIRPTRLHSLADTPSLIARERLGPDHARLYDLIFRRAVASQMAPARYDATTLRFDVAGETFKAAGRVLTFDGFLRISADPGEEKEQGGDDDKGQVLPAVAVGEAVPKTGETLEEKKTKPPGRFTLGSLVKELERLGIGRPSTYAAITRNIIDRGYVTEEKGKVVPLPPGETLVDYLRERHGWVIDYALTGRMEEFLDRVVTQGESWQRFCRGVHGKMGYAVPPARSTGGGPSEAQLRYARDLAARGGVAVPPEVLLSGKALSAWIAGMIEGEKGRGEAPPSGGTAAAQA